MAATVDNLVWETATTTGTGNFTVASKTGWRTFNGAFGTGGSDVFYYFIRHQTALEWQVGTGHLSASTTLVRDTVIASSNSDAAVNFSAGTKDVTCSVPASVVNARGKVLQVVQGTKTDTASTSSGSFVDTGITVTITPAATSSKILVLAMVNFGSEFGTTWGPYFQLVRGSTALAIGDTASNRQRASSIQTVRAQERGADIFIMDLDSPSTTSATTYKVQYLDPSGDTVYINRSHLDTDNDTFGRAASAIVVLEIGA